MNGPTLFDAAVRATDPDTSHQAAASMAGAPVSGQRLRVLTAIDEFERRNPHRNGATAADVVMVMAYSGHAPQQSVVARRCTDLRELGLITEAGTRPGTTGRQLTVWRLTEAGAEILKGDHQ